MVNTEFGPLSANPSTATTRMNVSSTAMRFKVNRGVPLPLGATVHRAGINFSIFSKHATSCTLVLFHPEATQPFAEVVFDPHSNRTGQVWHVFVEGLDAGIQYGYRFDMQPNP